MLEERLDRVIETSTESKKTELEVYMYGNDEKEKFKLSTSKYGNGSVGVTLDLPCEGFYDEDIPLMVETVLRLVDGHKDLIPDIYERLQDVCYTFSLERDIPEAEETLAHSYKIGKNGRLEDVLVEGDEQDGK